MEKDWPIDVPDTSVWGFDFEITNPIQRGHEIFEVILQSQQLLNLKCSDESIDLLRAYLFKGLVDISEDLEIMRDRSLL